MRRHATSPTSRRTARAAGKSGERGIALVIALMAMLLMSALGLALMLTTTTETMIAANYRDGIEGCTPPTRASSGRCRTC